MANFEQNTILEIDVFSNCTICQLGQNRLLQILDVYTQLQKLPKSTKTKNKILKPLLVKLFFYAKFFYGKQIFCAKNFLRQKKHFLRAKNFFTPKKFFTANFFTPLFGVTKVFGINKCALFYADFLKKNLLEIGVKKLFV